MRKKSEDCPPGAPLWMVTFSDMVTLLLTFFVLLLSMSSTDRIKFTAASQSLQNAFGLHTTTVRTSLQVPVMPPVLPKSKAAPITQLDTTQMFNKIKVQLELSKLLQDVELVKAKDDSIILRLKDSVLFEKERAILNPEIYPLLRKIGEIVRPLPLTMRIEGHTDSTPILSKTMSNWDLSVARAVAVLRFYKRGDILSLDRLSAIGYGAERPVVPNTTEENMAQNRRVDFILQTKREPAGRGGAPPL